MLLAIDIGNTTIHFGLFRGKKLTRDWRLETSRLSDYQIIRKRISEADYQKIRKVVVASVVPRINKFIRKIFPQAIFINHKNIGLKVRVKKPAEVGADRLVNALAAYRLYGAPAIVVDFGTATTFDVVSAKGEYLGGAIAPGILLARDILYEKTAKLPRIKIVAPRKIIGNDTVSALQSGLVYGYAGMVEGMIKRLKTKDSHSHSHSHSRLKTIATGGLAELITRYTKAIRYLDPYLTLKGLNLLA